MASKTLKSPSPDCWLPLLSSALEIGSLARTICLPLNDKRTQVEQIIRTWYAVDRWRVIILKVYGVQGGNRIVSGRHVRLGRASSSSLRLLDHRRARGLDGVGLPSPCNLGE
jgi:hypothetical protein